MSADRIPRTSLSGYFKGISDRIQMQITTMTPVIVHSAEMGDNDHQWFADVLRQYLPQRIGVDTGFVVNCQSDQGSADFFAMNAGPRHQDKHIGPQSDILLLDVLDNAPFCVEKTFRVCPVEMVLGVIEVTRFLDAAKLETDLDKIARVRKLAEVKRYSYVTKFDKVDAAAHRPLGYIVGLQGDVSLETIISKVTAIDDRLRPNVVAILDRALYVRKPYETTFWSIEHDVLFQFLAFLRAHLNRFPRGSADLRAYLHGLAEKCWLDDGTMHKRSAEGEYYDMDGTSAP